MGIGLAERWMVYYIVAQFVGRNGLKGNGYYVRGRGEEYNKFRGSDSTVHDRT